MIEILLFNDRYLEKMDEMKHVFWSKELLICLFSGQNFKIDLPKEVNCFYILNVNGPVKHEQYEIAVVAGNYKDESFTSKQTISIPVKVQCSITKLCQLMNENQFDSVQDPFTNLTLNKVQYKALRQNLIEIDIPKPPILEKKIPTYPSTDHLELWKDEFKQDMLLGLLKEKINSDHVWGAVSGHLPEGTSKLSWVDISLNPRKNLSSYTSFIVKLLPYHKTEYTGDAMKTQLSSDPISVVFKLRNDLLNKAVYLYKEFDSKKRKRIHEDYSEFAMKPGLTISNIFATKKYAPNVESENHQPNMTGAVKPMMSSFLKQKVEPVVDVCDSHEAISSEQNNDTYNTESSEIQSIPTFSS